MPESPIGRYHAPVTELPVPKNATQEQLLQACDFINMMPSIKFDNGTFLAPVEYTIGYPHPQCHIALTKEDYRTAEGQKKWKAAHLELVEQFKKQMEEQTQRAKARKAALNAGASSTAELVKAASETLRGKRS